MFFRKEPRPIKRLSVREGNTGILCLVSEDGGEDRYVPNYDLDPARQLLLEFQQLKDVNGVCLKDNYWRAGINWYPTVVNFLHGKLFAGYYRYRPLLERIFRGELELVFEGAGEFSRLVHIVAREQTALSLKARLFNLLVLINNHLVVRRSSADLLFFRFTPDDFRTSAAKSALDELGAKYLEAVVGEKRLLRQSLCSRRKPYYFYSGVQTANHFRREYDLSGLEYHKRMLFSRAVDVIERTISGYLREYRQHCRTLAASRFKIFYGIDDTQVVYPLLYACQQRAIRTLAHQHGAAYNKRHASYVMEGIDRSEYRWFDTLITWGEYWKDQVLALSSVYSPGQVVVGSDLFGFAYAPLKHKGNGRRNVLIPYEFLSNTSALGRYIEKLIDLGYTIYFKARSDEDLEDQIAAYCLASGYREKLVLVHEITPALMEHIDIIAGTASTLIYQLLPYGKVVWFLDTDYRYLEELVEQGYAHLVRYADLETLDERYFTRSEVDVKHMFNPQCLRETLSRQVLGRPPVCGNGE